MGVESPLFHLAEAREEHAAPTLLLHRAVLGEGHFFVTRPEEFTLNLAERVDEIDRFSRSPNSLFLLALRGNSVVGMLTLKGGALKRTRHVAKLILMVSQRFRGQGVGRLLMEAALNWATENPLLTKVGLAVFSSNQPAIALYHRFNFTQEGHRAREYRLDDGALVDDLLLCRSVCADSSAVTS